MRFRKRDIGRRLTIRFWDHSLGCEKPIFTEATGYLFKVDKRSVSVRWWQTPRDPEVDNDDTTGTIVRSTIKDVEWLDG